MLTPWIMFLVYILKVHVFYMYIFTPIFFKIQEIYVISQIWKLTFLFRVQIRTYGYAWMRVCVLVHNREEMRWVWLGGTWEYIIWGARWPGIFPTHHVRTHFGQKKKENRQQAPTAPTKARINHCCNLSDANAHHHWTKSHSNGENVRPAQLCANT